MAGKSKHERIDPSWPKLPDPKDAVSEFVSDKQGALSPFGELAFPMSAETVPYEHPVTEINK
ncbi:hypothetical protein IQ251_06245 [Saccharopolyspora sp. HNM0983]|uniref:Uncharacterized protein n=1 Tax=Saccharopolyspora montiporae TaxID=2781240 RepID=A0A929FZ08_9PSEU|nr:hypothetical protein [Saccharopolyspora sp. HNM0983]MBE9374045.1 hypothetical protein [Saccharopolyspora sp. HNM0983]